jgi:cysteine-rich repeat protein
MYTCHKDSDCANDPCSGAGAVCDTKNTHACTSGAGKKADGEVCGDNKSCYRGSCVENACNNGIRQPGEECDDGDQDERNGCTTKCKYSCVTGNKDYPKCANDCDLAATCDDATHRCVAGRPLAENALCRNGGGYCKNGGCVASVCGDGEKQPNEECDKGKQNGVSGSGCTAQCTLSVCGNKVIQGNEQCDDGNTKSLDGCDSHCKIEPVFRTATANLNIDSSVPDFCVYSPNNPLNPNKDKARSTGNSFAKLVSDENDKAIANAMLQGQTSTIVSDQGTILIHFLDVDDPTCTSADPLVRVGFSVGIPEAGSDWKNTANKLDFPMQVWRKHFDDQMAPIRYTYAEIKIDPNSGKAFFQSTKPMTLSFKTTLPTVMRNVMLGVEVDTPRSKVTPPPESADGVKVPESGGNFSPDGTTDPTGILCGALDPIVLAQSPLPTTALLGVNFDVTVLCDVQYNDPKIHLRACPNGKADLDAGKCSSLLDFLKAGCTSSLLGVGMPSLGDPDADTDGDGSYDSYTIVLKIAYQRVKMSTKGFAAGEPSVDFVDNITYEHE